MLRCAHTGDVHLGRAFRYLGEAAPAHQERLRRAFQRVFEQAQAHRCALVLIAGDLFDSPHVGREWVNFALSTIADARLPTVVIPGNHDPAERHPFGETALPSNLHFLAETGRTRLSALDLEIIACPAGDSARWQAALQRDPNGAPLQIALMHGSMPNPGTQGTIAPAWIAASHLDYVALGDWHSPQEWTQGQTVCWYSGAPEMILPRQQLPATMCLVDLAQGQPARVMLIPTGEARYPENAREGVLAWDLTPYRAMAPLLHNLQAALTPDTVATLRLVGRWQAEEPLDLPMLIDQLQPYCLWLEVQPAYQMGELTPQTPFEEMLVQLAQERQAHAPHEADLYREAVQLSLYLLRGGRL